MPGGYRIWDNKRQRWWGELYELCPDELLAELNMRPRGTRSGPNCCVRADCCCVGDDAALREAVYAPHGDGATSLLRPWAASDLVAGPDRDLALLAWDLERVFEGRLDVLEYAHIVDLRGEHRYPVRIPYDGAPDLHLLVLGDAEALALVRSDRDGRQVTGAGSNGDG